MMPIPGDLLDGYRLVRQIGSGGFGEVWLCRSEAIGELKALKFVTAARPEMLDKELGSLIRYRQAIGALRSPHLMPIEHINRTAGGLFYIMPLADGRGAGSPEDEGWQPLTLERMIHEQQGEWFSSAEIAAIMAPVLSGLQAISEAGLVHRDVKPANILFLSGCPCLADISLLGEDSSAITRRGTPGYVAPSWYVESGGSPDMFGAATTLYTLLTGNPPDKLGRSKFWWPPQGEASLSPGEHAEWKRLHAVIRRAVDDKVGERFIDFRAFALALSLGDKRSKPGRKLQRSAPYRLLAVLALIAIVFFILQREGGEPSTSGSSSKVGKSIHTPERVFKEPLENFEVEMKKLSDWHHAYDKTFQSKLGVLYEKLDLFSRTNFTIPADRLKELDGINSALDAVLISKPDCTPSVLSEKLNRNYERLEAEVIALAKTSEDRTYFFEQIKPRMLACFKASFDGLTPGSSWGGVIMQDLRPRLLFCVRIPMDRRLQDETAEMKKRGNLVFEEIDNKILQLKDF